MSSTCRVALRQSPSDSPYLLAIYKGYKEEYVSYWS
ncbi:protein of unknown function [Cyanobium sp. NIES-981]|nr:protein of unknown function [Cyanobium sp. NIES-981]